MEKHEISPVAYIRSDFREKFGIPRQSGLVKGLRARIVFTEDFRDDSSLRGIEGFSHLWLIFDFSESHRDTFSPTVRPPRLGGNERVGVFASRSPFRPNSLGLSSVKLCGIEKTEEGTVLVVEGADLLDMTPIYDIKPYIPYADCHPDAVGGYTDTVPRSRLDVEFPECFLFQIPEDKREALIGCIAEDPRPSYQEDEMRVYSMRFDRFDVHFKIREGTAYIVALDKVE